MGLRLSRPDLCWGDCLHLLAWSPNRPARALLDRIEGNPPPLDLGRSRSLAPPAACSTLLGVVVNLPGRVAQNGAAREAGGGFQIRFLRSSALGELRSTTTEARLRPCPIQRGTLPPSLSFPTRLSNSNWRAVPSGCHASPKTRFCRLGGRPGWNDAEAVCPRPAC